MTRDGTPRETPLLEALLSNPATVAYVKQQDAGENPGGLALAGHFHAGSTGMRVWFGEANGCTTKFAAKAPEHGGPAEVFVRGILTAEVAGVELVDADGVQLAFSANYQGAVPASAAAEIALEAWLRERIAEDRLRADLLAEDVTVSVDVEEIVDAVYDIANQRAVLAQCDADTLLLDRWAHARDEYEADGPTWDYESEVGRARTAALKEAVRIRAMAYQHRPGYREEWRPDDHS